MCACIQYESVPICVCAWADNGEISVDYVTCINFVVLHTLMMSV